MKNGFTLITGAAKRIGKRLAFDLAKQGFKIIVHHGHSPMEATEVVTEIRKQGGIAEGIQADLQNPAEIRNLFNIIAKFGVVNSLINNASIFAPLSFQDTTLENWQEHMDINLTAPFLLSQLFQAQLPVDEQGHIINILDWRALRPGADHFPYTVSKAGLAALTRSLAIALAPRINVNGIALGAILPPSDGGKPEKMLQDVPQNRVGTLDEVTRTVLFFLTGPEYITGEIIHLDGGRHLI